MSVQSPLGSGQLLPWVLPSRAMLLDGDTGVLVRSSSSLQVLRGCTPKLGWSGEMDFLGLAGRGEGMSTGKHMPINTLQQRGPAEPPIHVWFPFSHKNVPQWRDCHTGHAERPDRAGLGPASVRAPADGSHPPWGSLNGGKRQWGPQGLSLAGPALLLPSSNSPRG